MNWLDYGINGYRTKTKPVNGVIKRPFGFVVNELPGDYGFGEHTHFTLKKTGLTTIDAIKIIANKLFVGFNRFSYAGLKDKDAVTTQRVSAYKVPKEKLLSLKIKGIEINDVAEGFERISLGSHKGNEFIITLSEFKGSKESIKAFIKESLNGLPNFFGPQRFGANQLIGEALVNGDLKLATEIFINNEKSFLKQRVSDYLKKHEGNYLGALRIIDKRVRVLWVNAYQSFEWNKELSKNLINPPSEINLKPCKVKLMPELGEFKGAVRNSLMFPQEFKAEFKDNELILKFNLGKGEYATTLLRELMKK